MANVYFGWPNRLDAATLSGGSWEADLPLANLQTRALSLVARSTDDATASTKFDIDFGTARAHLAVALIRTNLSADALVKASWGTSLGGAQVYTTGWVNAFAVTIAAEGIEWPATGSLGASMIVPLAPAAGTSARYLRIEIDDTSNADGYVEIGRVFAGSGLHPTHNPVYGLDRGWDDPSIVDQNMAGSMAATKFSPIRTVRMALELLSVAEGDLVHEMQRRQGVVDEVLFLHDRTDRAVAQQHGYLARMKAMPRLLLPSYLRRSTVFELTEIV